MVAAPASGASRQPGSASGSAASPATPVSAAPCGDAEMAPVYLRRLLPVFCATHQASMLGSVRRASLSLVKKMVHYVQPALLEEMCAGGEQLGTLLVEVLAAVLDSDEDQDGHLVTLGIISDLMAKSTNTFLEHFARLGVISKVSRTLHKMPTVLVSLP